MKYQYNSFTSNRSVEDAEKTFKQRIEDAIYIYDKHHENFIMRNCPVCGSKEYIKYNKFIDLYNIDKCKVCNSEFVNPVPDMNALADYYDNCECNRQLSNIIKKRFNGNDYINDERVQLIIKLIKDTDDYKNKTINILEIGCNNGAFLSKLKYVLNNEFPTTEFNLCGVDIDSNAVNNPLDKDLNLYHGFAENISSEHNHQENYDFIIHFELVEHLIDPIKFVQAINIMLKTNGKMIFTTPNILGLDNQSLDYNNIRYLAHALFPPMHLNAFSTQNISHFLISNGFTVEDIKTPGKFDLDMITLCSSNLKEDLFKDISLCSEDTKAIMQELLVRLYSSSHMQCVAGKIS